MQSRVSIAVFSLLGLMSLAVACSSSKPAGGDGGAGDGGGVVKAVTPSGKDPFCSSCTPAVSCAEPKPVSACCVCTQAAGSNVKLQRATGLVYNSAPDNNPANVDLSCIDTPKAKGTSQMVTVTGYVKLFSSGNDSTGVKIEMFQEGPNGALGAPVGTPVITADMGTNYKTPKPTLWSKCPVDGCVLRSFTYTNVPTEVPLVVKTSDGLGAQKWAELYDYNVMFSNDAVNADGGAPSVYYEPSTVAATDLNTVASAAGGFTIKADRGLLAGEVHDCGDVRLSGAMVNTDLKPEGDMFYFGENEADPLPDKARGAAGQGTSKLGLFGALNYTTGTPIHISATGNYNGQTVLVGTYTVQVFKGAVTALSLRGRRPWQ